MIWGKFGGGDMLTRVIKGLKWRFDNGFNRLRRRFVTKLLHGPARVDLAEDEVMVVALLRDAAWYLPVFLNHHLALGVRHILIIDNGSSDDTVAIARQFQRVTVLENRLAVKHHESALRSELGQLVARGGWLMFLDADELAELPGPLHQVTRYCQTAGYTAVLGQMLDRFSTAPYSQLRGLSYRAAIGRMGYYALTEVESLHYQDWGAVHFSWFLRDNICEAPEGRLKQGGVRREFFGETPFLTKHSLVKNQSKLTPMSHPHAASGVRVADITLLLNHYKLAGDWVARDKRAVAQAVWTHGEDQKRLSAVSGDFSLTPAHPLEWRGFETLVAEGFLHISGAFRAFCTKADAPSADAATHLPDRPPGA